MVSAETLVSVSAFDSVTAVVLLLVSAAVSATAENEKKSVSVGLYIKLLQKCLITTDSVVADKPRDALPKDTHSPQSTPSAPRHSTKAKASISRLRRSIWTSRFQILYSAQTEFQQEGQLYRRHAAR